MEKLISKHKEMWNLMSTISEDWMCATWLNNLEYKLWTEINLLLNNPKEFSEQKDITWDMNKSRLIKLNKLSNELNGWFIWSDKCDCPAFVTLDDWIEHYNYKFNECTKR